MLVEHMDRQATNQTGNAVAGVVVEPSTFRADLYRLSDGIPVLHNLDQLIHHWGQCGIGPFCINGCPQFLDKGSYVSFFLVKKSLCLYLIRINEIGYQNRAVLLPIVSRGLNGNGDSLHEFFWGKVVEGRLDDLAIVPPPFLDFSFNG